MIDIDTSKHFIIDYEQFMAYTRDIKDIIIDITKADGIYMQ